jgi:hypothetical protein
LALGHQQVTALLRVGGHDERPLDQAVGIDRHPHVTLRVIPTENEVCAELAQTGTVGAEGDHLAGRGWRGIDVRRLRDSGWHEHNGDDGHDNQQESQGLPDRA